MKWFWGGHAAPSSDFGLGAVWWCLPDFPASTWPIFLLGSFHLSAEIIFCQSAIALGRWRNGSSANWPETKAFFLAAHWRALAWLLAESLAPPAAPLPHVPRTTAAAPEDIALDQRCFFVYRWPQYPILAELVLWPGLARMVESSLKQHWRTCDESGTSAPW